MGRSERTMVSPEGREMVEEEGEREREEVEAMANWEDLCC